MNIQTEPVADIQSNRMRSPFFLALLSGLLFWAALPAFPGNALSLLAWIAPIGWLALITPEQLAGRRPKLQLYAAAIIQCLLVYQFIRLPHWSATFGWIALALYMACYPLAFVLISRAGVHQLRLPLIVVAPVVWTGLELFRGHFFYGLSTPLLGHTQIHWNSLIQIADLAGAYAVSFLIVLIAACIWKAWLLRKDWKRCVSFVAAGASVLIGVLFYGDSRINVNNFNRQAALLRVALIQGAIDTIFPGTQEEYAELIDRTHDQYRELSIEARQQEDKLDLIVWPETMFNSPSVLLTDEGRKNLSAEEERELEEYQQYHPIAVREAIGTLAIDETTNSYTANLPPLPAILGATTQIPGTNPPQHMNSALLVDADGTVRQSYHKMHPVPFGEFLPFGGWFPALYSLAPISGPLTPGEHPECFQVQDACIAPSICFESIVPHLILRQVRELTESGNPPDVLLNMTNDGWFWGSNALDQHLTCNAFRAIETRTPMLVCANTGFSAEIDCVGRVLQRGPRRDSGIVYASIQPDNLDSLYLQIGDWPAGMCLLTTCLIAIVGSWRQRLQRGTEAGQSECSPSATTFADRDKV